MSGNDDFHAFDFDAAAGTFEGRAFPREDEWLGLEPPADLVGSGFVDDTLTALAGPTPEQLAAFAAPEVAAGFTDRVLGALQDDRRERWREMLARYVAPAPSPAFVARTLSALAEDRAEERAADPAALVAGRPAGRLWLLPLLAAAAALLVVVLLPRNAAAPIELRATSAVAAAFAPAHATSPLPALLTVLDHDADPQALSSSGGDGPWLMLGGTR